MDVGAMWGWSTVLEWILRGVIAAQEELVVLSEVPKEN